MSGQSTRDQWPAASMAQLQPTSADDPPAADRFSATPWLRRRYAGSFQGQVELAELTIHDAVVPRDGQFVGPTLLNFAQHIVAPDAPLGALLAMRGVVLTWLQLLLLGFKPFNDAGPEIQSVSWHDGTKLAISGGATTEVRLALSTGEILLDADTDPLEAMNSLVRRQRVRRILGHYLSGRDVCDPAWTGLSKLDSLVPPAELISAPRGLTFAWPVANGASWIGGMSGELARRPGLLRIDGSGPIDLLVAYAWLSSRFEMDPIRPRLHSRRMKVLAPRVASQLVRLGELTGTLSIEWPLRSTRGGGAEWECRVTVEGLGTRAVVTHGTNQWGCMELACMLIHRAIHAGHPGPLGLTKV